MLIGVLVTVVIALGAGALLLTRSHIGSHAAAAAVNGDCTLIVPPDPLTAQGLATPWQLVATNPNNGPCNQANTAQTTFVQGAVFDPATGQISIYNPLVIDQGTKPAVAPMVPTLPQGAVVALWGGSNANNITLQDTNGSLQAGKCVNGSNGSIFGQFHQELRLTGVGAGRIDNKVKGEPSLRGKLDLVLEGRNDPGILKTK